MAINCGYFNSIFSFLLRIMVEIQEILHDLIINGVDQACIYYIPIGSQTTKKEGKKLELKSPQLMAKDITAVFAGFLYTGNFLPYNYSTRP